MKTDKSGVYVKLEPEELARVKTVAAMQGQKTGELVRKALREYLVKGDD
jgi:hypothetical protein